MGDNDFPTILAGGFSEFLNNYLKKFQNQNPTQLPTTGEYAQFANQPQGSTGGSRGEFDRDYIEKMNQPVMPMPEWMRNNPPGQEPQTPGQGAKQAFGGTQFPTPFGGSRFDIAGGTSFEIPKGQGALGRRSGEQLQRIQESGIQNEQLQQELERRGMMPRGIQLPPV
jgi:hypothetical protein